MTRAGDPSLVAQGLVSGAERRPVFRVDGLSVTYEGTAGPTHALDGVSLEVWPGEVVAVVGPSGCGKSTLLRALGGLLPASARRSGTVAVATGARFGYIPQRDALLPWRTVLGNAEVGLEIRNVPRAERRRRAESLLESVGLARFRDHRPHELSGGMRQRLSLARALVHEPDVILMDEPFAALDAFGRAALQEDLLRLWERLRIAVVLVTHDLGEALVLGRRVIAMTRRPGRILGVWPIELPEPRSALGVRASDSFLELSREIWQVLAKEVAHDGGALA